MYIIARSRIQKKECYLGSEDSESSDNQKPDHHHTGHSEFMESEDSANCIQEQQTQEGGKNVAPHDLTNFPLEQATQEVDKNENIELDEYDGPKKVEESNEHFEETLDTGYFNNMRYKCIIM